MERHESQASKRNDENIVRPCFKTKANNTTPFFVLSMLPRATRSYNI